MTHPQSIRGRWLVALGALLMAFVPVCALASGTSSAAPTVSVHYAHPQQFTEARKARMAGVFVQEDYLSILKKYIRKRAARILAPGQRLDITVTDVDLAGEYEPWLGPQMSRIRIIRDMYPPRIDLHFTLYAADGSVLRKGSRKLVGLGVMDSVPASDQEPLRYEKALIDRWLQRGPDHL